MAGWRGVGRGGWWGRAAQHAYGHATRAQPPHRRPPPLSQPGIDDDVTAIATATCSHPCCVPPASVQALSEHLLAHVEEVTETQRQQVESRNREREAKGPQVRGRVEGVCAGRAAGAAGHGGCMHRRIESCGARRQWAYGRAPGGTHCTQLLRQGSKAACRAEPGLCHAPAGAAPGLGRPRGPRSRGCVAQSTQAAQAPMTLCPVLHAPPLPPQSLSTDNRPGGFLGALLNRPPGKMDHATVACYQVRVRVHACMCVCLSHGRALAVEVVVGVQLQLQQGRRCP